MENTDQEVVNLNRKADHPLQTWEWGQFRKATGNEVVYTKHGLVTVHQIPFTKYKIGVFEKGPTPTREMLRVLTDYGLQHNLIFIKLEPFYAKATAGEVQFNKVIKLLKLNGCVKGKTLFTPTTFIIDLEKSEEDLLKSFTSKTRYNIRLAQKYGVRIEEDNSKEAFEKYLELTAETVERQGFYAHSKRYHRLMWESLRLDMSRLRLKPIAHLLVAKFKGEIITTWILFEWHNSLYYPYGASSEKYKYVMANNLMMWEAIRFGKKQGLSRFDLWGREEGKGFTRFKEGYNPRVEEFLGSWDLVINLRLYQIYKIVEKIRWLVLRTKSKFFLTKPKF